MLPGGPGPSGNVAWRSKQRTIDLAAAGSCPGWQQSGTQRRPVLPEEAADAAGPSAHCNTEGGTQWVVQLHHASLMTWSPTHCSCTKE